MIILDIWRLMTRLNDLNSHKRISDYMLPAGPTSILGPLNSFGQVRELGLHGYRYR